MSDELTLDDLGVEENPKQEENLKQEETSSLTVKQDFDLISDDDIASLLTVSKEDTASQLQTVEQNVSASEVKVPRAIIIQDKTPVFEEEKEKASQDEDYKMQYRLGDIVDSSTMQVISQRIPKPWLSDGDPEKIKVDCCIIVVSYKLPSQFVKWKDRKTDGKGFHFSTLDKKDPRVIKESWPPIGTWGQDKSQEGPPPVTEISSYVCNVLNPSTLEPVCKGLVLPFSKATFKQGRFLYEKMKGNLSRGIPLYAYGYYLWTETLENTDNQKYKGFSVATGVNLLELAQQNKLSRGTLSAMMLAKNTYEQLSDPERGRELQEQILQATSEQMEAEAADDELQDDEVAF